MIISTFVENMPRSLSGLAIPGRSPLKGLTMRKNIAAQLDAVHSVIGNTLDVCAKTNKSKTIKAELAKAKTEISLSVEMILAHPKARSFSKTRKSLVAINNTVGGLLDGLSTHEISMKSFRAVCSNLQSKFIPDFVTNLANDVAKMTGQNVQVEEADEPQVAVPAPELPSRLVAVKASLSAGKSLKDQLADIKAMLAAVPKLPAHVDAPEHDEEDEPETEEEKAEREENEREREDYVRQEKEDVSSLETLQILRRKRSLLPQRLTNVQMFQLVKLPLVPIFPENFNVTSERNLLRAGVKHTMVQGYAFLQEQLILCVSRTEIDKANGIKEDSTKIAVKGKISDIKKIKSKTEERGEALTARSIELSNELVKLTKKFDAIAPKARLIENKYRKTISEIYKISKPEKERIEASFLTRKESLSELDDSETKQLRRLHTNTGVTKPTPDELAKLGNANARQDALEKHRKAIVAALKAKAAAHIATLSKLDRKKLEKLKTELEEMRTELKSPRALQKRIKDLKEMLQSVTKQLNDQASEIERRDRDIHEAKKGLKPKTAAVSPADYAMTVLAHVNEVSHSNYTLVTPEFKVNIRNADILCFWVMPTAKLNSLLRDAGGKTKVQWSFPWDA